MVRYQIIKLIKKRYGFQAVIVDNKHPSGIVGEPIQWFETVEKAVEKCVQAKVAYEVIDEVPAQKKVKK